jgi:hypothetical protein
MAVAKNSDAALRQRAIEIRGMLDELAQFIRELTREMKGLQKTLKGTMQAGEPPKKSGAVSNASIATAVSRKEDIDLSGKTDAELEKLAGDKDANTD